MANGPWTFQPTNMATVYPSVADDVLPSGGGFVIPVQTLTPVRDQVYQAGSWPSRLVIRVSDLTPFLTPQGLVPFAVVAGVVSCIQLQDTVAGVNSPMYVIDDVSAHCWIDGLGVSHIDVLFVLFTLFDPFG
jgi:hypothetical protein